MGGKINCLLNPKHRVYDAVRHVLGKICKDLGWEYSDLPKYSKGGGLRLKTRNMQYFQMKEKKDELYVLLSPLVSINAPIIAVKGIPAFFVEEYNINNDFRDIGVSLIHKIYQKYPFLSLNKHTHEFLRSNKVKSFLVPPAQPKKEPGKKRDVILSLGRIGNAYKNPGLFLDIAEKMPDETFVMLGGKRYKTNPKIEKRAKDLANVTLHTELIPEKKLEEYWKRAKLLVHTARKEPVAAVIPEALGASVPVLASKNTGASSYLPGNWVMDNFDRDSWIARAKEMLNEQKENERKASEVFMDEHLWIEDGYFDDLAEELEDEISKNWPGLV